jgi:hypothetical protein
MQTAKGQTAFRLWRNIRAATSLSVVHFAAGVGLQQCAELFDGEAGVADDTAHGDRVHGIMPRDRQNARTISHHDVLSLPQNDKPTF